MLAITTYTSFASARLGATGTGGAAGATGAGTVKAVSESGAIGAMAARSGSTTVSALACQLNEAVSHAQARDGMTQQQLGDKARALLSQISGETYFANKAAHDAEVPDTDDPTLLARARQATDFVNGRAVNPFKGMSRDQLALIAYDESGTFTVNERRAASVESDDQEYAWRQKVVQDAMDEYNRTGEMKNFFANVLSHYRSLPDIEKAQYPEDYASKLQDWIDQGFNEKASTAQWQSPAGVAGQVFGAVPIQSRSAA